MNDQFIAWALSAIAVASFALSWVIDHYATGSEFTFSAHLMLLALGLLSLGTFIVSTLGIVHEQGWQALFVAFNRAVLAGVGVTILWRTIIRYRTRPKATRDR